MYICVYSAYYYTIIYSVYNIIVYSVYDIYYMLIWCIQKGETALFLAKTEMMMQLLSDSHTDNIQHILLEQYG